MQLQKHISIPERVPYLEEETLTWGRLPRQVFWLSDGRRDTQKIALLLHQPVCQIEKVTSELQSAGCIHLRRERKVVVMNVALLKESFEMITPYKNAFAQSFYRRLFLDSPQLRPLFAQTDMRRQESSLMATLALVVAGVQRGDNLAPALQQLGEKHQKYGAKAEYYPLVGATLLETFHQDLGSRFTPAMQQAWEEAFEMISTQMINAAEALSVQS